MVVDDDDDDRGRRRKNRSYDGGAVPAPVARRVEARRGGKPGTWPQHAAWAAVRPTRRVRADEKNALVEGKRERLITPTETMTGGYFFWSLTSIRSCPPDIDLSGATARRRCPSGGRSRLNPPAAPLLRTERPVVSSPIMATTNPYIARRGRCDDGTTAR